LKWDDTTFADPMPRLLAPAAGATPEEAVSGLLVPSNFRDLNMAQASGARFMMASQAEETRLAFEALVGRPGEAARKALLAALEAPYPYAHYLAAQALAARGDREATAVLIKKLDPYIKAGDTVGFWACCDALGRLKARDALPVLVRFAVPANPPGTFGPEGMATAYAAAKALGQIVATPEQTDVARLLASDIVWLKAGVLRGLAEAQAPGIDNILRQAAEEEAPAVVRQEARIQLARRQSGK
jgi:hypothetical protein